MIKYRIAIGFLTINKVEATKESEHFVWIKKRRCKKITDYECYFDTWEEAKKHLVKKAKEKKNMAKERYRKCKADFLATLNIKNNLVKEE